MHGLRVLVRCLRRWLARVRERVEAAGFGLNMSKLPDQPIVLIDGVVRFKANNIVRFLLDRGGFDLNELAAIDYLFTQGEWEQFYQLIGYSVSGFGDLSNVSEEARERCEEIADRLTRTPGST